MLEYSDELKCLTAKLPPPERIARFTTDQYFEMIRLGIIPENSHYELLDGLIVLKDRTSVGDNPCSVGAEHVISIGRIAKLDRGLEAFGCHIKQQSPIILSRFQAPVPDGAVVQGIDLDYQESLPRGCNVFSVIEVSGRSLTFDLDTKLPIYAGACVPQCVILNLADQHAEVYEEPKQDRAYGLKKVFKRGQSVPFFAGKKKRFLVEVDFLMPQRRTEKPK